MAAAAAAAAAAVAAEAARMVQESGIVPDQRYSEELMAADTEVGNCEGYNFRRRPDRSGDMGRGMVMDRASTSSWDAWDIQPQFGRQTEEHAEKDTSLRMKTRLKGTFAAGMA